MPLSRPVWAPRAAHALAGEGARVGPAPDAAERAGVAARPSGAAAVAWAGVLASLVSLLGLASLAGCVHPDPFGDGVLRKEGVVVRVGPVPSDWRRIAVDGADLAFHDDAQGGSALFNVRCGQRDDDAPLSVLTEHLIMGTTAREFDAEDTVAFDGREALHTLLRAKLDGVSMQYDIYVMKKDGCVYDLVYVAPPGRFATGAAAFEPFATGLRTEGAPAAVSRDPCPRRLRSGRRRPTRCRRSRRAGGSRTCRRRRSR